MRTGILTAIAFVSLLGPAIDLFAAQNVVVVLDDSGSMSEPMRARSRTTRMAAAQDGLITVLRTVPAESYVGILGLNHGTGDAGWIVPLGPVDQSDLETRVRRVRPRGPTPLGQQMKVAVDALLRRRAGEKYGTYRLLIVTDGEATDSPLVELYLPEIVARGITVDVIGVDMKNSHSLATKVHSYRRADDPAALGRALQEVFAESSAKAGDAGESDFALIAPLPDGLAEAALKALHEVDDRPVGGR